MTDTTCRSPRRHAPRSTVGTGNGLLAVDLHHVVQDVTGPDAGAEVLESATIHHQWTRLAMWRYALVSNTPTI